MLKNIILFLFCLLLVFFQVVLINADELKKQASFELYGVVKSFEEGNMDVYSPNIDKTVKVEILRETIVTSRLDKDSVHHIVSEIKAGDLVVIKGVVEHESFLCNEVSFLPIDSE